MEHLLVNLFCAAFAICLCASFLFFDRLLGMAPEGQPHQGGRVVGIFGITRQMSGKWPKWCDLKAVLRGLRLYVTWLFRTPTWVRNDSRARTALWTMRLLFWLNLVGVEVVKETLL